MDGIVVSRHVQEALTDAERLIMIGGLRRSNLTDPSWNSDLLRGVASIPNFHQDWCSARQAAEQFRQRVAELIRRQSP
jgi:hypothetical protein